MNRRSILSIGAATALGLGLLPAGTVAQQKSLFLLRLMERK
jgi:hypothetical protein